MNIKPSRRDFLAASAVAAIGARVALAADSKTNPEGPKLKKAIKYGAVEPGKTPQEKFEIIKSCGFVGVELDSPSGVDRDAVLAAAKKTGVEIHGVIDSVHWKKRLSDPDEKVRAEGLEALKTALKDGKFYGATTCLLVPGRVDEKSGETFDDAWSRSQAEVKKAIPLAEEAGVKIAIEVVWNNFITKPEQLVKYIDELNSPSVGAYFDVSNMIKYGVPPADWIRALGKRMLKFDFKGYSNEKKWVKIGDGDENWPEVLKALKEVGYEGFATAEVPAPTVEEMKDISARMDRCLGLA